MCDIKLIALAYNHNHTKSTYEKARHAKYICMQTQWIVCDDVTSPHRKSVNGIHITHGTHSIWCDTQANSNINHTLISRWNLFSFAAVSMCDCGLLHTTRNEFNCFQRLPFVAHNWRHLFYTRRALNWNDRW